MSLDEENGYFMLRICVILFFPGYSNQCMTTIMMETFSKICFKSLAKIYHEK